MKNTFLYIYLFLTGCFLPLSAQTTFFVAPHGDDRNTGKEDSPFLTPAYAQQQARACRGVTTIYLRQGIYRLTNPLVFTTEDGNDKKELIFCSYPGEQAVISGGVLLDLCWEPYKNGIMKATLASPPTHIDMLTVNGEIRPMARYPNYDSTAIRFNGTSEDATSPTRVKKWKHPEGGYLHAMHAHDWGDFHYRITGKDKKGKLALEGGHQNNRKMGLSRENRMVENIFEELDSPGEWYYDTRKSVLYYYPLPGENILHATFEVPQLKHLIEWRGSSSHPIKNITVKGIELTQTVRTFMDKYEPLLRSDWTIYRGGAVVLEGTENCHLVNCYLHNLGGNAVFFSNYNRHSTIVGSHITRIGASAVCFVGDPQAVRSPSFEYGEFVPLQKIDRKPGPRSENYPADCKVYDNLIYNIGLFEKQVTGIELSMCRSITVSHNSIYDTPRSGINVSEGTWGGHIIEYNDVFDTVKETGDHGSFNSWGRDRFWHPNFGTMSAIAEKNPELILADVVSTVTIRNNRFRCDRGWDIDLDDGSSNYHIYSNLCLNGGIKLREGFYRVVENNILVNNTFHPHVWFKNSGNVFTRNIVMTPYQPIHISHWDKMVDYNIFTTSSALEQARKNGTDKHSIYYAATFCNPEKGDYRVEDSNIDVFRMGFLNFEMNKFGVVSPHLKQLAKTPKMALPVIKTGNDSDREMNWYGWTVKNLETLGERSATGMDSERGVYVIASVAPDSPLKGFIQPNDVILQIGEMAVNTLDDLRKATKHLHWEKTQEVVIFRNQQEARIIIPAHVLK